MKLKEYFNVGEVFTYFFRKKDPNAKPSTNMKLMYASNKIAIVVFLICLVVILYRLFIR